MIRLMSAGWPVFIVVVCLFVFKAKLHDLNEDHSHVHYGDSMFFRKSHVAVATSVTESWCPPPSAHHLPPRSRLLVLSSEEVVVLRLKMDNSVPYKEGSMPFLKCNSMQL